MQPVPNGCRLVLRTWFVSPDPFGLVPCGPPASRDRERPRVSILEDNPAAVFNPVDAVLKPLDFRHEEP